MTLRAISALLGLTAAALQAAPIDCGTVASPIACSIQVGGQVEYIFSNFSFINGTGYTGSDIGIELNTGGGLTALVTFAQPGGGVFLANSGQTKGFLFSYDVVVNAILPGTAAFDDPSIVSFGNASALNGGFATVQMTLTNNPNGETCQALKNAIVQTQDTCDLPLGTTDALQGANRVNLSAAAAGPQGENNVSFLSFSNLLSASFTPGEVNPPGGGGVPEPSTWAMLGTGLVALGLRGRRKNGRG